MLWSGMISPNAMELNGIVQSDNDLAARIGAPHHMSIVYIRKP